MLASHEVDGHMLAEVGFYKKVPRKGMGQVALEASRVDGGDGEVHVLRNNRTRQGEPLLAGDDDPLNTLGSREPRTMKMPGKDAMDVVVNGSIQFGICVNGLRARREPPDMPAFPIQFWPGDVELNVHRLIGEKWEIVNWDAALTLWPCGVAWRRAVQATLRSLTDEGCTVAWLGSEGFLCDPPHLFDPECMTTGVLAALTASGRFICPIDPCELFQTLTDEEMLSLREEAADLAMST